MSLATESERADAHRNGFVFILDLSNIGYKNFDVRVNRQLSSVFSVTRCFALSDQESFPMRYSQFILVNPPTIIRSILGMCRFFLKKKLMDRVLGVELRTV